MRTSANIRIGASALALRSRNKDRKKRALFSPNRLAVYVWEGQKVEVGEAWITALTTQRSRKQTWGEHLKNIEFACEDARLSAVEKIRRIKEEIEKAQDCLKRVSL
jgi:hypothetical protein